MKIHTLQNKTLECEPTQEAIENLGISTYNHKLVIKHNTGYLIPLSVSSGNSIDVHDEPYSVDFIKINIFNLIFKRTQIKNYLNSLTYNNELLLLRDKASHWELEVEYVN